MPTKISVPTGSTPTLVAAAKERQFIAIQNQGTADVFLAWDLTASSVTIDTGTYPGYKLTANAGIILSADIKHPVAAFSGAIYAVHGNASTQTISVQEI